MCILCSRTVGLSFYLSTMINLICNREPILQIRTKGGFNLTTIFLLTGLVTDLQMLSLSCPSYHLTIKMLSPYYKIHQCINIFTVLQSSF